MKCLPVLGMNVGNIGLVVITLERYFKVVHAIAHRKYYKKWMTKVGVAVPWIAGFGTFAIPLYTWTTPVKDKAIITVCVLAIFLCTE